MPSAQVTVTLNPFPQGFDNEPAEVHEEIAQRISWAFGDGIRIATHDLGQTTCTVEVYVSKRIGMTPEDDFYLASAVPAGGVHHRATSYIVCMSLNGDQAHPIGRNYRGHFFHDI